RVGLRPGGRRPGVRGHIGHREQHELASEDLLVAGEGFAAVAGECEVRAKGHWVISLVLDAAGCLVCGRPETLELIGGARGEPARGRPGTTNSGSRPATSGTRSTNHVGHDLAFWGAAHKHRRG